MPAVSVVIPLYNKHPFIARALRSVTAQSHAPAEIIVIDDGSSDGSAQVAHTCPMATVVSQPHAGPGAARNHGIETAQSEWIAFLDADDEWASDFLVRTMEMVTQFPSAIAVFSNLMDEHGRVLLRSDMTESRIVDDYFRFLLENRGIGMSSSTTLARRDALIRCGAFPVTPRSGEDFDTWARLAWSGPIAFTPEPLATYHKDAPESVSKTNDPAERRPALFLETYATWRTSGLIPAHLMDSSRHFVSWFFRQYVAALAHDGQKGVAWQLLYSARTARILPPGSLAMAALRLLTPTAALRTLRRVRQHAQ